MNEIVISRSKKVDKKYDARINGKKTVSFGGKGYQDFTQHKDPKRQKSYLARHKHDPTSITTAGGLARDILWSKPSLPEAVKYAEKKHGVKIKMAK